MMELDPQRRSAAAANIVDDHHEGDIIINGGDHERTSSMENEPRTLSYNQIHFAREAALHVVRTRSLEEAISVFTRGMERGDQGRWSSASGGEIDSHKRSEIEEEEEEEVDDDRRSMIFRVSGSVKRDIATAPF